MEVAKISFLFSLIILLVKLVLHYERLSLNDLILVAGVF